MKRPQVIVVDASIAAAFVFDEALSNAARKFFAAANSAGHQLVAPELWRIECANVCRKSGRRLGMTEAEVRRRWIALGDIPLTLVDTADLHDVAFDLALRAGITAYDALYVITADYAGGTLVTADGKLIRALTAAGWPTAVMHIETWV